MNNHEKLPIKKYSPEELKAKIGESAPAPKLRLVKEGETKRESDEERRERMLRETEQSLNEAFKSKE